MRTLAGCDNRTVKSIISDGVSPVRVVVIDDHALFARGLQLLLGPGSHGRIEVVASTSNPDAAEELVAIERPDVAIVDLTMPGRDGVDVVSALRSEFPALKILVVSGTDDLALVRNAFNAGADGFLPKTSDPSELLAPLQVLADGGSVLPKRVLSSLLAYAVRPSLALPHLDSNDVRLLRTLASGVALDEVAAEFLVSERTAKRLIADLLERLGVSSRIQAVALAGRAGLLDED